MKIYRISKKGCNTVHRDDNSAWAGSAEDYAAIVVADNDQEAIELLKKEFEEFSTTEEEFLPLEIIEISLESSKVVLVATTCC